MVLQSSQAFIFNFKDIYHEAENMKQSKNESVFILRAILYLR